MTAPGRGGAIPFFSICSGIEAASIALDPLGFRAVGYAEIDKAASELLAHRYGSNMPSEPLSRTGVPNHGDFTSVDPASLPQIDWLIGGTPCQAFSIAGKRMSLADARGNLSLAYTVLAHELVRHNGLKGCLWENVPGVLNTPDNAFGCFLAALVGHDRPFAKPRWRGWPRAGMADGPRGRLAWRVFDAQYFGLAQRRARVFVVASFGDGIDPAQILFEPQGQQGNSAPRREKGEEIAGTIEASLGRRGGAPNDHDPAGGLITLAHGQAGAEVGFDQSPTLTCIHEAPIVAGVAATLPAGGNKTGGNRFPGTGAETAASYLVAHSLRGEGFDASEDGTGRGTPIVAVEIAPTILGGAGNGKGHHARSGDSRDGLIVPVAHGLSTQQEPKWADDISPTLALPSKTGGGQTTAVAYDLRGREGGAQLEGPHDTANIRAASGGSSRSYVAQQWAVRRLTPRECERLQGFPDDYTAIPGAADGPRYKQLGNSFAVPVIRWFGDRILEQTK